MRWVRLNIKNSNMWPTCGTEGDNLWWLCTRACQSMDLGHPDLSELLVRSTNVSWPGLVNNKWLSEESPYAAHDRGEPLWKRIQEHVLAAFFSPDHIVFQRNLLQKVQQYPVEGILAYKWRFQKQAWEACPDPRTPDQQLQMVKPYSKGLYQKADAMKLVTDIWPAITEAAFQKILREETGNVHTRVSRAPLPVLNHHIRWMVVRVVVLGT